MAGIRGELRALVWMTGLAWNSVLLGATNAIDRIDFGNAHSEATHHFNAGINGAPQPVSGTGALSQTFRAPFPMAGEAPVSDRDHLSFDLRIDPARQNYLTVRLWGNDCQQAGLWLLGMPRNYGAIDWCGGPPSFPNRFYYETIPIPQTMTQSKESVTLTLYENNVPNANLPARPIYSAYSHAEPDFVPDEAEPTGVQPAFSGQLKPIALDAARVQAFLRANREAVFKPGGYYEHVLARQVPQNGGGSPRETWGLDLGEVVTDWIRDHPRATADEWRDRAGSGGRGAGYATMPDELLSLLITAYQLPVFTDPNGKPVAGLDHFHDPGIIARIVSALDGSTCLQSSDGSFQAQPQGGWQGATSTARAAGHQGAGTKARGQGWSISLEGADTGQFGLTIVHLLDDSTARPIFLKYLKESFDADLVGGSILRAHAYERMLNNQIVWQKTNLGGGTVSQALFNVNGLYLNEVALQRLEVLFPFGASSAAFTDVTRAYPMPYNVVSSAEGVEYLKQAVGVSPTSKMLGQLYSPDAMNFTISRCGLGEAGGVRSGGYDGRYGRILPWFTSQFAQIAAADSSVNRATLEKVRAQAKACIDAYAHFISPSEDFNGVTNRFVLAQEDFVTYRDPYNPNANANNFSVAAWPVGADPAVGINSDYSRRSLYLSALYDQIPDLHYLKDMRSFEIGVKSLTNIAPELIRALPGEIGEPSSAWVDPQTGAVAAYFNGERLYVAANWRNYDIAGRGHISCLARIHDTTATIDRAALVFLPCSAETRQTDGNITGGPGEAWVVTYGNWLIMGNPTTSMVKLYLPACDSQPIELISGRKIASGSTVIVNAGDSAVINLQRHIVNVRRQPTSAPSQPIANGVYTLMSAASGLFLDSNSSTDTGTQMVQNKESGQPNQQWKFRYDADGFFKIENQASKQFLTDVGGQEQQKPADGSDRQLWRLIPVGIGQMLVNKHTNDAIDLPASSLDAGCRINPYLPSMKLNQTWLIR